VYSIRQGILEVFKVQGLTVVLIFLWAPNILDLLGISRYYLPLFYIDLVGVSVQVLLMSIMNVYFYLDRRGIVLALNILFFVLNLLMTAGTQVLGPSFFGYGFAGSITITTFIGFIILNRTLEDLEYETFMLQK
ncbi:MAG: exopolysaccharide Pel transporter PelG, partial [Pseudomonadales bacterium]